MNNLKWMLAAVVAMLAAVSCGPKKEAPKVLVLYYSQTGNTKVVADEIATRLGADVEALQAAVPYDGTYQETIERCIKEREQGTVPEIQPVSADVAAYDVIFLGYPIWFGTYAPPVAAFLRDANLAGKKVVPFCTFGSGGLDSSVKDLAASQPEATILPGYGVRAARMEAVPAEIDRFLKVNGFVEGDFAQLEEFPEQHPVTEEEAAIFDAAVKDYRMMNAKATTVASRAIPNGVEYLFTAVDQPREMPQGGPQGGPKGGPKAAPKNAPKPAPGAGPMPPREMKVYVTVVEGEQPVFTQVVR